MILDRQATEEYLKSGDLRGLFNEMGWDNPVSRQPESIDLDEQKFSLLPIAEKRGVVIYQCDTIPNGKLRKKIEREIRKITHEHLIVFTLQDNSKQVWQWVARGKGEAEKFREHAWHTNKSPEPLIQKLNRIAFSLPEEEELTLSGTTRRLQSAFEQEDITRRFYESFKKEHKKFLDFVEGLAKKVDREWYASLMLNRLMFVYFIQKRGFLDNDIDYLQNRFDEVRKTQGPDRFHGFYRAFLLRLFHGGLATPVELRDEKTVELIGNIPYLNGGLFEPHAFEEGNSKIQIPDEAFKAIFSFFDRYQWALDTRLTEGADGNQINPDVLGHIFEKYINQKQKEMGAYYTQEDITGYITQNTIIPWLLKKVESVDGNAFARDGFVWRLLHGNADRYIYKEVAHGTELGLPEHIAAGIKDASKRGKYWNGAATGHGLPTEIWRETIARRQWHSDIQQKMASGSITNIEDLITYNLNISQFVQDVIREAESPDLIRMFWDGVKSIKVIDPTCGSGAFLFAALKVLHDIYDACLEQMEQLVEAASETKNVRDHNFSYFQEVLGQIKPHENRSYFIYKEIILYNLYGVDIMSEAVEICKLRLFLKLASELRQDQKIEALPDIDFNIRAGNSLVGYTSPRDMENAIEAEEGKLKLDDRAAEIRATVKKLAKSFTSFRQKQMELDGRIEAKDKQELRGNLQEVVDMLDRFLAQDYKVKIKAGEDLASNEDFQKWREKVQQPFHWWVEFYDIMDAGGFDVIIGNPPYLEASKVHYSPKGFRTKGTIHGYIIEQSDKILSPKGGMSMILPIALVSTKRMKTVQEIIETGRSVWYSNFSWRPAKLFNGVNFRFSTFVSVASSQRGVFTTGYKKWSSEARKALMPTLAYVSVPEFSRKEFYIPKFQSSPEAEIFNKVINQKLSISEICGDGRGTIYYRGRGVMYWFVFTNFQPKFFRNGVADVSSTQESMSIKKRYDPVIVVALLSSNVFWWWYTIRGDCWDLTRPDIQSFRTNANIFDDDALRILGKEYLADINKNSDLKTRVQKRTGTVQTQSFAIKESKPIIDKIDAVLSRHYGFTAEELDFIQNYDIKFRVGAPKATRTDPPYLDSDGMY